MRPGYLDQYTEEQAKAIMEVHVVKQMGWTLDYYRTLNDSDKDLVEAYLSGVAEAENASSKRGSK